MNEKCFGLRKKHECTVLAEGVCNGNYALCPFYKPVWMYERDRKRALVAISRMPLEKQLHISEKYYQGKMPWDTEDV